MPFKPEDYHHPEFKVIEIEPGFINLQFNNPKTLNAFSESTWRGYQDLLEKIDKDADTKVILISSPLEKAFTSGLNLKDAAALTSLMDKTEQEKYNFLYKHIIEFQHAISTPARIRTPTICLLNGVCYGLAIDIAATTSIRVVVKNARLSIREIKIGIVADMGSLQRLPFLVGNKSKLNQYALTGEVFSAEDALELGLVSKVLPDYKSGLDYCIQLGKEINSSLQWTIKGTKDSLQYLSNGGNVKQGLLNIADYNAIHIGGISSKF